MTEQCAVKVLRATDLDVTLYDPARGLEALADIAERDLPGIETHVGSKRMMDAYRQSREENRTFQAETYMREQGMSEDNIAVVYQYFSELAEPDLLFPDAKRYIERVNASPIDHLVIHTTGLDRTQLSKLGAVGLLGPHIVTPHRIIRSHEKGKDIANNWRNENGLYVPPGVELLECEMVVLVDDRRDAVGGMDFETTRPYVLERPEQSRRGADIAVPVGAIVISSLDEISVPLEQRAA